MPDDTLLSSRKSDHIRINLAEDVQSRLTTGFEKVRFLHCALPEFDLDDVDMSLQVFGKKLRAPILISSMTGGTPEARIINLNLATAAQNFGLAMGLGSQRAGLERPDLVETFQVRSVAPDILLFANLGAVQLNYRYGVDECRRAVEMVEADGLYLHLNALQEAVQPEGDTRFSGLLKKIEMVCRAMSVPVVVKEVGWGISGATARQLVNAGVAGIDVAGAGGTSWSQVEMHRIQDPHHSKVAASFRDWGIPTVDSLLQVKSAAPDIPVFASGGLRTGVDVAKAIALGATLGGMAGSVLKAAVIGVEEACATLESAHRELQIAMFASGCKNLHELAQVELVEG